MGKASKWFKSLLGFKKSEPSHNPNPAQRPPPSKKRWSFTAKSHKEKDRHKSQNDATPAGYDDDEEASRHARAVAAATAAVAEAAVAAAQAAAAVVKLTSGGAFDSITCASQNVAGYGSREERAAILIQSHFRAYLSREALRALKALVKLQALVRGQILRKHYVRKLREMEAIARVQARSRAVLISEIPHSSTKSSPSNHTGRASQEKVDHVMLARSTKHEQPVMFKRNGSRSSSNVTYDQEKSPLVHSSKGRRTGEGSWEQGSFSRFAPMDDERSDKILEVDTWKPHVTPKRRTIFHSPQPSHSSDQYSQSFSMSVHQRTGLSPSSGEVQSLSPLTLDIDGNVFSTAENSPQYYSASSMGGSSKRAPFTPTKSDGSRSCLSGYSDHPSYMAYTESSKAKVRSLSAPKQRPQYERSSSTNRYSVHGYGDSRPHTQKASTLHANLTNKAYPGSGHLDRFGMPVSRGDFSGFSGGHLHRY